MSTTFIKQSMFTDDGRHVVTRHEDDGTITEVGEYLEAEHAMSNAVSHYLFHKKAVRVYVNLVGSITIDEIPRDSPYHPDYRPPFIPYTPRPE